MPLGFKSLGFEPPDSSATATATATAASSPLAGLPSDSRHAGQPASHSTDIGKGGLVSTDAMSPQEDLDIEGRPPYSHAMLAGGLGGAFGDMLMHSLDTVKTRQQGDPNVPSKYRSLASSYYTIIRQEGIRRGLYGGWLPALSGSFPGTLMFFGTYEWSKRFLIDHGLQHHLSYLCAGFLGDLAASVVYVPSEVLKTRLQLQGRYNNPHFSSGYNYRGTVDAARTIVRTEGPAAMFHGYKATLYRDLPFSALQFMFYEQFQTWARKYQQSRDIGVGFELLTGATAGGLAGVITCPLDVVKTRLQTQVNQDNIATDDKMNNTAGSFALIGAKVPEDSTVAAKLRKAGAIILGKANLSQWAYFRSNNGSSGWTSVGGQTIGAYFPGQDPSGSSSGSGVASSIGLAWACLGTETFGSIISPSQYNNLVGIKPTVGLTSRYLVVPISEHQDTVGPMARTVKDAAHLLGAIAGKDNHDKYTSAIPFGDEVPDYVAACKESGLKGKRIGIPRGVANERDFDPAVVKSFREAIEILRSSGAVIVENIDFPGVTKYRSANDIVLKADFFTGLPELYLKNLVTNPNNIHSLADLREFTHQDSREDWPERDTGVWDSALERGYGNDSPQFQQAYKEQLLYAGQEGLAGALKNHSLDAVFAPSAIASNLAAPLGHPAITLPIGRMPEGTLVTQNDFGNLNATSPNQPFGVGFAGDHFSEEALIGMAYALEQQTQVRTKIEPIVVPKTELKDVVGK